MTEEYYVEDILADRFNKRLNRREWQVKWEGWEVEDCTWEPLENLENNVVFQAWCQKHNRKDNRKRKREPSEEPRKKPKTSNNLPPQINYEPPQSNYESVIPLPDTHKRASPVIQPIPKEQEIEKEAPAPAPAPAPAIPSEPEKRKSLHPHFQIAVNRLRKVVNLASNRCQRCLGICGYYDNPEDFLEQICFQPRQAALLICQLVVAGHTTVPVTWKKPLVWFAEERNATYMLHFPREGRGKWSEGWLNQAQDFSTPVIAISVRSCEELRQKEICEEQKEPGTSQKQEVHYALAYDFLNSAFVLAFEQGQYPGFRISHLDAEKVDLLLKETATMPSDLEQFQLQSDLRIDTSSLLTYIRQDISDFIVRRCPPGFAVTERAKLLAREKAESLKQLKAEALPVLAQPEALPAQPEAFLAQPEALLAQPEALLAQPEAFLAQPEAFLAQPEAFLAQPEAFLAQPEALLAQPEAFLAEPEAQFKSYTLSTEPLPIPTEPLALALPSEDALALPSETLPTEPEALALPAEDAIFSMKGESLPNGFEFNSSEQLPEMQDPLQQFSA